MKPNFLGIGAVRGGSTWLHEVLKSHPDFYLPSKRKEVQYFTRFYDKGPKFYESFFPEHQILKSGCKWYGEITPGYLREPQAPRRIAELGTIKKIVMTVRNPIDRAYSHYKWHIQLHNESITFMQFYSNRQGKLRSLAIENGLYAKFLKQYLQHFHREQFLIIPFEEIVERPSAIYSQLKDFFNLEEDFISVRKKNQSVIPKYKKTARYAHLLTQKMRKYNLDFIPNAVIRYGGKNLLGKGESKKNNYRITLEDRENLTSIFYEDVQELKELFSLKLDWKDFR